MSFFEPLLADVSLFFFRFWGGTKGGGVRAGGRGGVSVFVEDRGGVSDFETIVHLQHFIAYTDTYENKCGVLLVADAEAAVLCNLEGAAEQTQKCFGHTFYFIADTERHNLQIISTMILDSG